MVLGFDGGCFTCTGLAQRIEERVDGKIEVRSLTDPQVQAWRRKALGEDAPWAPTLFEIKDLKVRAWTGPRMGVALARFLGPVATWRVMQVLGEMERPMLPATGTGADGASIGDSSKIGAAVGMSRMRFLKGAAGVAVATSVLLGSPSFLSQRAFAQSGFTNGTTEQRRTAKTIIRNSPRYKRLADLQQEIDATFDFSEANLKFRRDLGLAAVYSAGRERGVIAIFFVDMRREVVVTYNHQVWLPNSRSENLHRADILSYTHGEAAGKFHHIIVELLLRSQSSSENSLSATRDSSGKEIYDGYVISNDGHRRTFEQFNKHVKQNTQRSQSVSRLAASSSCEQCREDAELFCQDVSEVQCTLIDGLGGIVGGCAAGAIITAWSGPGAGAGCAAGGAIGGIAGALGGIGCGIYNNHISAGGSGCSAYARSASGGCIEICSGGTHGSAGSGVCAP